MLRFIRLSPIFIGVMLCNGASSFAAEELRGWDMVPEILKRIVPPKFADKDFVVTDFGAKADGGSDSRPAFTNAIAACSKAGGGRVVVPAGTYRLDGPVHLLSHVNLHLAD